MEIPSEVKRFREELEKTCCTANEIKFVPCDTKPWESKLGGCPYLETLENYPTDENGNAMMFLAQINLEEMPPLEGFPTKGILQFYIEDSEDYGYESPCKVICIENYTKNETILVKENPYAEKYAEYLPFEKTGKAEFVQKQMFISSTLDLFYDISSEATKEEETILEELCDASGSRMGGYPMFVQNIPECYEDGTADILLLQLDVDDEEDGCGIMFGDLGNCQFMIAKEDLAKRDFSNVQYDWACC